MTRRSSHPCREWEGPSSPRCSQKPRMPCSDATGYAALRSLAGVAPVTKRSGKSCVVVRRQACHDRLANAVYHWGEGVSPFSTIRAAAPNMPNSDAEVIRPWQSAAIGRRPPPSTSPAPCSNPRASAFNPASPQPLKTRLINGGESHHLPQRRWRTVRPQPDRQCEPGLIADRNIAVAARYKFGKRGN